MGLPAYINDHKERYMTGETNESEQQANREKYALLKEFHRTLRQALTGAEYKVFCAIEDWSESKGECWHSQSTIADACDISIRSVNASVKQLETFGLVETKERNGQSSTYTPAKPTYAKIAYLRDNLRKNCIGGYAKSAHLPTQNLRINVSNINGSNNNDKTTPNGVAAAPPKSTLIDLVDTGSYREKQPEPKAKQTYPANPAPKTGKKVKGVSSPDPVVKVKPRDPNLDNPAVKAYTDRYKLTPNPTQRDLIVTHVTDLGEWGKAMEFWDGQGYRPLSVNSLVDCYVKGNYKNELPGTGNRNDRGPGRTAIGNNGKVAANGASPKGTSYVKRSAEDVEREWAEFRLP